MQYIVQNKKTKFIYNSWVVNESGKSELESCPSTNVLNFIPVPVQVKATVPKSVKRKRIKKDKVLKDGTDN